MDHYREAEKLLQQAADVPAEGAATLIARAHVHAILALANRDEAPASSVAPPRSPLAPRSWEEMKAAAQQDLPDRPIRVENPYWAALQEAAKRRYGSDWNRFDPNLKINDLPEYGPWKDEEDRRRAAVEERRRERERAADRDEPRGV